MEYAKCRVFPDPVTNIKTTYRSTLCIFFILLPATALQYVNKSMDNTERAKHYQPDGDHSPVLTVVEVQRAFWQTRQSQKSTSAKLTRLATWQTL